MSVSYCQLTRSHLLCELAGKPGHRHKVRLQIHLFFMLISTEASVSLASGTNVVIGPRRHILGPKIANQKGPKQWKAIKKDKNKRAVFVYKNTSLYL